VILADKEKLPPKEQEKDEKSRMVYIVATSFIGGGNRSIQKTTDHSQVTDTLR
jgi:hypothetical protein